MDKQSRLAELKQAAEAQMRRLAPAIGGGGPEAKRQKRATADDAEEEEAAVRVARYNYAAPEALLGGALGLLVTCGMTRQMSATKESFEVIKRKLPPGSACSMVKVGCRGVVLMLVQQQRQQEQQQQQQKEGQGQEQQQQQQQPPGEDQQDGEQQEQHQEGEQQEPTTAAAALDVVDVAASVLADVESGVTPHARFAQRIIPVQTTCALQAGPLRSAAAALCQQYVALGHEAGDAPIEFAVAFKNRGFEGGAAPAAGGGGGGSGETKAGQQPAQQAGPAAGEGAQQVADSAAEGGPQQQQQQQQQQGQGQGQEQEGPLQRDAAIKILADAMSAASGGRARVNLKAPAVTVIAEVVPVMMSGRRQLVAALAVVPTARLVSVKAKGLQVRTLCKGG